MKVLFLFLLSLSFIIKSMDQSPNLDLDSKDQESREQDSESSSCFGIDLEADLSSADDALQQESEKTNKRLQCTYCDFTAHTHYTLAQHEIQKHVDKQNDKKKIKLASTSKKIPQTNALCCSICNKTFKYAKYLKVHVRLHTGERPYACTLCPMKYVSSSSLRLHRLNTHKEEAQQEEAISSSYISYSSSSSEESYSSQKEEQEVISYKCALCDLVFAHESDLLWHKNNIHDIY